MNILHINAADSVIGGASRVAMDLFGELEKRGITSSMFVGKKFSNNPDIHEIPKNSLRKLASFFLANDLDFFDTDFILQTKAFRKADIVQCHNLHGWYFNLSTLRKMANLKPVVWTLHDMWSVTAHCSHSMGGRLENGFYRCPSLKIYPPLLWHNEKYLTRRKRDIYSQSKINLAVPSQWLKSLVENSVLKDKPLRLIPNGIDIEIFRPYPKQEIRKSLGLPADKKIILFLSSTGKDNMFKGWQFVREVAQSYADNKRILFLCLGKLKGDAEEAAEKNIMYVDKTDSKKLLATYYSACDMLLFTSLAENFPLVTLEAMACGLPIVSFDVGGVKEAVTHKANGYIVKYKDAGDLKNGVDFILGMDPGQQARMATESVSKVRGRYDLRQMAESYLEFYKSLIKGAV